MDGSLLNACAFKHKRKDRLTGVGIMCPNLAISTQQ